MTVKLFSTLNNWFRTVALTTGREFRAVFSDTGVILFFFCLPLFYPIVYTLIYNPEIVTDMPVVVVDQSGTAASRDLIRRIDATQSMKVYTQCLNLDDARRLYYTHQAEAIFVIPADYSRKIGRMEQANVSVYCDMSLLLRYRALLLSLSDVQLDLISDITAERTSMLGASNGTTTLPVQVNDHIMGDPTQGFASFVIPGIVVLILQQSMLLGITLLGGTRRERRLRGGCCTQSEPRPVSAVVLGRTLCYFLCYMPMAIYALHFIPWMFSLPQYGSFLDAMLFITPLLLATAFLGQALVFFTRQREMCFILVVFTSVVMLFLSGLTWPRYAMSNFWTWIGNLVPATWGIEGFIRINSNAATLAESSKPYMALWILTAVYLVAALAVGFYYRRVDRRLCTANS